MSSYKVIYEGWRRHLNEAEPVAPEATTEPEADPHGRKLSPDEVAARKAQADASKAASDEPDDQDKIIAGINSREYPDSLINLLKPDPEKPGLIPDEQLTQLLQLLLKATEEDDIVLEALGGPERDPRTFSPNTVRELNKLVASFRLDSKVQQKLEKTLNKWAKMNTVKFSAASTSPTAPGEEDTDDEDTAPVSASHKARLQKLHGYQEDEMEALEWWGKLPEPQKDELASGGRDTVVDAWRAQKDDTPEEDEDTEPGVTTAPAGPPTAPAPEPEEEDIADDKEEAEYMPHTFKQAFEDGKGWLHGARRWVDATPKNAYEAAIVDIAPWSGNYKQQQKLIEDMKYLQDAGGGVAFEDSETSTLVKAPEWVVHPISPESQKRQNNPDGKQRSLPLYHAQFLALTPSLLQKLKDFIKTDSRAYEGSSLKRLNKVPEETKKNLDHMIKAMERQHEKSRKPEADDPDLQETLDRWQTIAGINKRIL